MSKLLRWCAAALTVLILSTSINPAVAGADTRPDPISFAVAVARAVKVAVENPLTCGTLPSDDMPTLIAQVFRCRLGTWGISGPDADRIVAEAVTIAHCESGFDPNAVVFGGRYLHTPHPATGTYMSAAGLFQFIRTTADGWIDGGYANVHDPVGNTDAAARLWHHNVSRGYAGWLDLACYAANDGFAQRSVIPGGPGGPAELPWWAWH